MAPSRYDWKIVDWDVKPQHNQPTISPATYLPTYPIELTFITLHHLTYVIPTYMGR